MVFHARDNGSSVNLVDTNSLNHRSTHAQGGLAEAGASLLGLNSAIRATGANASGLYVAGAPGFVSNAHFVGSILNNVSGPTIGVGGVGNVSLTNSTAVWQRPMAAGGNDQ